MSRYCQARRLAQPERDDRPGDSRSQPAERLAQERVELGGRDLLVGPHRERLAVLQNDDLTRADPDRLLAVAGGRLQLGARRLGGVLRLGFERRLGQARAELGHEEMRSVRLVAVVAGVLEGAGEIVEGFAQDRLGLRLGHERT